MYGKELIFLMLNPNLEWFMNEDENIIELSNIYKELIL